MKKEFKPKITVFYCINTFARGAPTDLSGGDGSEVRLVKMACSSMVKDVYLLRAFETGADAVIVMVCPEGQCRYIEGNLRARKRVTYVQKILDSIGLDGQRLAIHSIDTRQTEQVAQVIRDTVARLVKLGPSPAK